MKLSLAQALLISSSAAKGVTMYEHYDSQGWAVKFGPGHIKYGSFPNDQVSSFKVDDGCCAQFFYHDFQGESFYACGKTAGVPEGFNDQISSVKVSCFESSNEELEDELTENITLQMNEANLRKINDKMRNMRELQRSLTGGKSSECDRLSPYLTNLGDDDGHGDGAGEPAHDPYADYYNCMQQKARQQQMQMQKEVFGWTFEEKYDQIKPEQRYMPLIRDIMGSKQFQEAQEFGQKSLSNPLVRKIMKEAEWLKLDTFGGHTSNGWTRGIEGEDFRKRVSPEQGRDLDRYERSQLEFEGFHLDNDRVKDVFEDAEHIFEDVETLLDPKGSFMSEAIKLDAAMRFSPKVQELIKMILKDFNITSKKDLLNVAERVEHILENSAEFYRFRKAAERIVRFAVKNVDISDIDIKDSRVPYVNRLMKDLAHVMQNDPNPVQGLERMVERFLGELSRGVGREMSNIERMEQSLKPKGMKGAFDGFLL